MSVYGGKNNKYLNVTTVGRGPAVMGIFGKPGLQGLPTRVDLPLRDIQLRLSKGATGVPLFTTWDSVAGPGRTPRPGNNSGRRQTGFTCCAANGRPPGRRWILDQGLRVGGPGRPPCWRTLKESCWRTLKESRNLTEGLGSVSLN